MAPSIKTLQAAFGEAEGTKLRRLLTGKDSPEIYQSVQDWLGQCYNRPSEDELIMTAANEIMDGSGLEVIRGRSIDNYSVDVQAVYVNTGDTYSTTLLLDNETGRYQVTTWGDWYEKNEKRRQLA